MLHDEKQQVPFSRPWMERVCLSCSWKPRG